MNDWFEWNGVRSTEYGMHVLAQPSVILAAERVSYADIPGRSGSLTILEGEDIYSDITIACTCVIDSPYRLVNGANVNRISAICGWLHGNGTIMFATQDDCYYYGRIANQISFDQIVRGDPHRSFQVQFRCRPYRYLNSGLTVISASSGSTLLNNPGNVPSEPLLRIVGTGEGTIMCGSSTMLVNSFDGIAYLMADCEAKIAYCGTKNYPLDPLTLLGTRVSGNWLTIPVGQSHIVVSGSITGVTITPRWRCAG